MSKVSTVFLAAVGVAALVGVSYAAYQPLKGCNNKDWYATHQRFCGAFYQRPLSAFKQARADVGDYRSDLGGASYHEKQQTITIRRDFQGGNGENITDVDPRRYIVLQTAEDVARDGYRPQVYGWYPSVKDLYVKHPTATAAQQPQQRVVVRTVTKTIYQ